MNIKNYWTYCINQPLTNVEKYRKDILSCVGVTFTHSMGKRKTQDTELTAQEFTSRLRKLRDGQRLI